MDSLQPLDVESTVMKNKKILMKWSTSVGFFFPKKIQLDLFVKYNNAKTEA